jgi:hypothetical protein
VGRRKPAGNRAADQSYGLCGQYDCPYFIKIAGRLNCSLKAIKQNLKIKQDADLDGITVNADFKDITDAFDVRLEPVESGGVAAV